MLQIEKEALARKLAYDALGVDPIGFYLDICILCMRKPPINFLTDGLLLLWEG